jgi:hypothetical protein
MRMLREIFELAVRLGQNSGEIRRIFNAWLFAPITEVLFLQNVATFESLDSTWRAAHQYEERAAFAELAVRLVSCAAFQSDVECALSLEKDVPRLYSMRLRIGTVEVRLKVQVFCFTGMLRRSGELLEESLPSPLETLIEQHLLPVRFSARKDMKTKSVLDASAIEICFAPHA